MSVRTLRYNTIEQHFTKGVTASTDRDALAFLEAAQIYNTNQQRAIVNLVRSLKRVGLWTKMKAIYPFIGGTATTHKWNLKDPRDSDAAFRLTFSGGWTHSSTGATPNGTNAYADTFLIPNTELGLNSNHCSFYSRTNQTAGTFLEIGCSINTNEVPTYVMILRFSNNNAIWQNPDTTNRVVTANSNTTGYYVGTRTASNLIKLFKNNASFGSNSGTHSQTILPTVAAVISAYRFHAGVSGFSSKEVSFATFGDGLTDTDATNLYNIVDLYQKRLGRAV